jgi:hypothetical protein
MLSYEANVIILDEMFSYLRHLFEYIGTQFPPTFQFTVWEDGFDYIVFFFF